MAKDSTIFNLYLSSQKTSLAFASYIGLSALFIHLLILCAFGESLSHNVSQFALYIS